MAQPIRATLLGCSSSPARTLAESSHVPGIGQIDEAVSIDLGWDRPSQVIMSFLEGANGGWVFRRATAILVFVACWRRKHESLRDLHCSLDADEGNFTRSRFYITQHTTRAQT